MDLNHRSPGYEPDGISRLPHLATPSATVHRFESTAKRHRKKEERQQLIHEAGGATLYHARENWEGVVVARYIVEHSSRWMPRERGRVGR